uniref:peptide-methionine (S)-S-oxide reductase n=1 Tax=Vibrio cholerae TaxID=666 RepID=UPI003F58E1AE
MLDKQTMVTAHNALPGRTTAMSIDDTHFVNGSSLTAAPQSGQQQILIGMGCFWGAERLFWQLDGVISTSVGYSGGLRPIQPMKKCAVEKLAIPRSCASFLIRTPATDRTAPRILGASRPTQGMRQGNDRGTQYRSAIYTFSEDQREIAEASKAAYQALLTAQHRPSITTEILPAGAYYFAETYHQQYLAKNPNGYCGLGGTGVCFPPHSTL